MQRVPDHATAVELSAGDPWVRWSLPVPLIGEVWEHERVLLVERVGRRRGFWVAPLGRATGVSRPVDDRAQEAARVRSALLHLRDGGHLRRRSSASVSVVQDHAEIAHEVLDLTDGGDWDWMWVEASTVCPVPGRRRPLPAPAELVTLDDTLDAREIADFTRRHNPRVWTQVGTGQVHHWVGLRGPDGELIAIGGAEREASGVPHLGGIVTARGLRGRGLGTAVTAELTAWALEEHGVCTLGMFSDNQAARAIYTRLGYRTARAWHSRGLALRG